MQSIDPSSFDPAVRPVDDFFGYVNNQWLRANPIPPEESRWGSFDIMRTDVEKQLLEILEHLDAAKEDFLVDNEKKVRSFYRTGMNMFKRNAEGDTPLKELFDRIDAVKNAADLSGALGYLHRHGVSAFWVPYVDQDLKQSEVMALNLYQGGLSLPDRDYYLSEDPKSAEIRKRYMSYLEAMGASAPDIIFELEKHLAERSMTRVELRDYERQYNKMTPAELASITPHIHWQNYFQALEAKIPDYMIVAQPLFMQEVDRFIAEIPLGDIKQYLRWHVLNSLANFLSEGREKKMFDFYGRTFAGSTQMKPHWRRVLAVINMMLDEALGEIYIKKHFGGDAKKKINHLVDHLIAAYRIRIQKLEWMTAETKEKALAKLGTVSRKLGYPDKWKDITTLVVVEDSYAMNYARAYAFEFDRQMKKIGKPVDRSEWLMPPQMVNAYYQPPMNEIAFPAAILQPPFFDPAADDAMNFGGIGTVIGHELTHGFDDQGALFDLNGNLKNWWTPDDKLLFDKQTAHLAEQYDEYEPLPGLHVNGKLTLGENIADLGGLLIAYDGLQLALQEHPQGDIDGLSQSQRFFINYAITEKANIREENLRLRTQTDPHSPSQYRVNGPLSNMVEFYDVFDAKPGDKLYRDSSDRVKIW